jgi:hypothetical protein
MRTAGLTMNDVWADRVLHERGTETYRYEGLSADIGVFVESVELKHRSKDENYRPYLHISGELRRLTPAETLPYGISQVTYSPGQGEKVDAFYEFDDQQLVALTTKGYFHSAFAVPEQQITGIEWELPATMDALVLAPSGAPADVPVVFTQVHDIAGLEIDLASSGYDLTDYFDDTPRDGATRVASVVHERGPRARPDAINSLFPEEDLNLADHAEPTASAAAMTETATEAEVMGTRLQQVEADIAAERDHYRAEREHAQGTPENIYRTYVALPLRTAEDLVTTSPGHAPAAHPDVDLGREEQEARPGRSRHVPTFEERKRELTQRASELHFGDDDGHDLGS